LSFSFESNKLVAMTAKGTVYEIPFGLTLGKFTRHTNTVRASAFAPVRTDKGAEVIATAGGEDNDIYIWNAEDGEILQRITGKGRAVWSVAFGKGLQVAFGNIYTRSDAVNRGPLQKVFDFGTLKLDLQKPDEQQFKRAVVNAGGRALRLKDDVTLVLGNGREIRNTSATGRSIRTYSYTPQGWVVVGSAGSLRLYDVNGQLLRDFIGHTAEVWAVSVSEDGKYLVSAGNDQTVILWNLETGEMLASLFVTVDNDWICWTPQGYYSASAGGEQYIGWHVNKGMENTADFYPVKNFQKQYFLPELVKLTIDSRSFEKGLAFYKQATGIEVKVVENVVAATKPPVVQWLYPERHISEVQQQEVTVRAKVNSELPITAVKVLVDGRPLSNTRGFKVEKRDTPTQKWVEFKVPVSNRETKVQIFASNEQSNIVSEERILRFKSANSDDDELDFDVMDYIVKPNLYLLSIGVSEFRNADWNLNYADDDAKAIVRAYSNRQNKLYGKVVSKLLTDREATKSNILEGFSWLEKNATHRDMVIIFIASHGFNEKQNFFILPHDGDPENLTKTAIRWDEFAVTLSNLPSRVLVFLDACHSGQLGVNMARVNNTEALRNATSEQVGVVIMAASTGDEVSFENPEWGHGAFTLALLEGIEKGLADIKPDKVIYLNELNFFVPDKVRELTKGKQNPTLQQPSTISRMPVAALE
jgi:hypothetical protein